ncbi:CHASE2 domain-containing protein [Piscinibacter sp.]|jgi:CHASE2 domain-containing sensor protein|uniref:CHASE2 domain-containing protein n=1 Tax=Piscinibacter sp. TaxID=1903157 RepID=UPI00355A15CF
MRVFISYRRDDSIIHAQLIHNELAARFGADAVFMDIDDIGYGDNFAQAIDAQLDAADVVVAVIGPRWAELLQVRLRGDDYVRHELARALARGIRVVPVLVGKAAPPGDGLPADLLPLRTLNCLALDERALKPHLNALVETIQGRSFEDVARDLQRRVRSAHRAQFAGAGVGLAVFFAAWVSLLDFVGLDTRLASATMWLGGLGASAPWSGEVVLVAITPATIQSVGRPFDASWRREHARLIERLAAAGARTVAFDLFLERAAAPADDQALESAIRAARNMPVIFAVQKMNGDVPRLLPRFAGATGWGIACAGRKLGVARSMHLMVEHGEARWPSLALAAFSGGGAIESVDPSAQELRVRVAREQRSPDVGYSALETVRRVQPECEAVRKGDRAALQLFDPALLPALREPPRRLGYEQVLQASDLTALKGKIVLVGLELPDKDMMAVATGPAGGERWGVELHAEQIDAIVRGDVIRPLGAFGEFATMVALALAGAFARRACAARPLWLRTTIAAACVLAIVALVAGVYRNQHLLINLPYALAAFWLAWWTLRRIEKRGVS